MKTILHSKPTFDDKEVHALRKLLLHPEEINMPKLTERGENALAKVSGQKYGILVNSGTSALHLALLALGIGKKHEVILPAYTCTALLNAVHYVGATPRLVDVNEHGNMTFSEVRKKITLLTRAIIVPHQFGLMAPVADLKEFGVPIIEDCAMAIGASADKKPAGSFGDIAIFSFYSTKVLGSGEGGGLTTSNAEWAEKIKDLREYDKVTPYQVRYNYKMSALSVVLLSEQLKKLPLFLRQRRVVAANYTRALKGIPQIQLPSVPSNYRHIFYRYVIHSEEANELREYLQKQKIQSGFGVRTGLVNAVKNKEKFLVTEKLLRTAVSLPIYPSLSGVEQQRVIRAVKIFFNK